MSASRSFPADRSSMKEIREFMRDEVATAGLSKSDGDLALDISQAAAKAVGTGSRPVQITLRISEDRLEVRVGSLPRTAQRRVAFAEWLAGVLKQQGLSQEAAARRIGVSLKTVNRWVRGHTEPRLRELRQVERVFGEARLG